MKSLAHRIYIGISLLACVTNVGCARLRSSYNPGTPLMLGAAAPFGKTKPVTPGGDLYAQEVGRGISHSRTLLAQDRARTKARNQSHGLSDGPASSAGNAPLQVALQPPETIQPGEKRYSTEGPAPAADELGDGTRPGPMPTLVTNEPTELIAPSAEPANVAVAGEAKSSELEELISASHARLQSIKTYQVAMKRQERVGGSLLPAEEALLSIRREPRAVRLEWPDGPSKGREVIYSAEDNDGLMHVKVPDTIVPVPPISMAIDSPMVMRNSRHPITEAGYEIIVDDLVDKLAKARAGDLSAGKITYEGLENSGQLEQPSHKIKRVTPEGEIWLVYLDPSTKLPVMVEGTAANGELLERYLFGSPTIDPGTLAQADAFDHTQRWGPSSGLLSRLAKVGGGKVPAETQAQ